MVKKINLSVLVELCFYFIFTCLKMLDFEDERKKDNKNRD